LYRVLVVGFTATYAISANHHWSCEFEPLSGDVYSIEHYVIKFASDLQQVCKQIWTKLGRNVHWMVIYKIFVFGADRKSNMAARAHIVFWLVEILKIFLLETTKPIELWLREENF
jgi:hypothetical protein